LKGYSLFIHRTTKKEDLKGRKKGYQR